MERRDFIKAGLGILGAELIGCQENKPSSKWIDAENIWKDPDPEIRLQIARALFQNEQVTKEQVFDLARNHMDPQVRQEAFEYACKNEHLTRQEAIFYLDHADAEIRLRAFSYLYNRDLLYKKDAIILSTHADPALRKRAINLLKSGKPFPEEPKTASSEKNKHETPSTEIANSKKSDNLIVFMSAVSAGVLAVLGIHFGLQIKKGTLHRENQAFMDELDEWCANQIYERMNEMHEFSRQRRQERFSKGAEQIFQNSLQSRLFTLKKLHPDWFNQEGNLKNFYGIFGLEKSATAEQIKKAFRKKVVVNHPDHGGETKDFNEIYLAYQILGNPDLKQKFDGALSAQNI